MASPSQASLLLQKQLKGTSLFCTKPHLFIYWFIEFLWVFLIFYIWFLDFQFQIFARIRWMGFQLAWLMRVIFLSGVWQLLGHQILYSEFFVICFWCLCVVKLEFDCFVKFLFLWVIELRSYYSLILFCINWLSLVIIHCLVLSRNLLVLGMV